jgi:2-isopropylmalate synthase
MPKTRKIHIFDTTLRDGEQSPGASLNTPEKLRIAEQLARMQVDVIEAGFPASSPGDFEAVKLISAEIKGPVICGLTRAIQADIDAAAEALKKAERPRIHTGLGVSDVHLKYKLRKTREQALEMGVAAVKHARHKVAEVEYFLEDAGRADPEYIYRVIEAVIAAGATVINVPDTTGYSYPDEWGGLIAGIREHVPNIDSAIISVHCHNDLGLAVANALAGVMAGADQVECTVNGIGERAGNTSLEEVVMAIASRKDLFRATTGIRTKEIYQTSRLVSDLTGIPVQPNKAIVGANAFAHSSGIHQDGVLKERTTYEIIDPRQVGIPESRIVLSARSGRHGLRHRLSVLGYDFKGKEFEQIYARFLDLADKKKEIGDADLQSIVADEVYTVPEIFHLDYMHVVSGSQTIPTATVRLLKNGEVIQQSSFGVGSVDAVYQTIDDIAQVPHRLLDYVVKAVTGGTNALGEVSVRIADSQGNTYTGRGTSTDIIEASARAYVQAINKLAFEQAAPARAVKRPAKKRAAKA